MLELDLNSSKKASAAGLRHPDSSPRQVDRVRLLDADPDLGRFLSPEELVGARQWAVPVVQVERDGDRSVDDLLEHHGAFAALVLEGIVLRELQVSEQLGMRLIGSGELLAAAEPPSMLARASSIRALPGTRLALLGRELLIAVHRWPGLMLGLQQRWAEQADRLTTQLVICQLPRVDQRLLGLMWLLAESWGHVTPAGTTLPLKLTHDAFGALIGARRPTVTLALRELSDRGAIVRQDQGWLLLEVPPDTEPLPTSFRAPWIIDEAALNWRPKPEPAAVGPTPPQVLATNAELKERLQALRKQHEASLKRFGERLERLASVRDDCERRRERLAQQRLTTRPRQPS